MNWFFKFTRRIHLIKHFIFKENTYLQSAVITPACGAKRGFFVIAIRELKSRSGVLEIRIRRFA
jgi:hypothetical protein